jgi:MinD-like ATPase involved in chromosome partitioning or flagellar assembly
LAGRETGPNEGELDVADIVSVHSFRGGTGKSNLTANVAALAALAGKRVAVIDADVSSPGIHVLFGLGDVEAPRTLNDYLFGACEIDEAVCTVPLGAGVHTLHLIPSSLSTGDITRVLREGYDVERLNDGFSRLIDTLALDYLFIDTHPGLNEETLLSVAVSDCLIIVLRPDEQDYLGTSVTVEVARRLAVPALYLVLNKAYPGLDVAAARRDVGAAYGAEVLGVIPHSDDMMRLASAGLFALRYPDHPVTDTLREVTRRVTGGAG